MSSTLQTAADQLGFDSILPNNLEDTLHWQTRRSTNDDDPFELGSGGPISTSRRGTVLAPPGARRCGARRNDEPCYLQCELPLDNRAAAGLVVSRPKVSTLLCRGESCRITGYLEV